MSVFPDARRTGWLVGIDAEMAPVRPRDKLRAALAAASGPVAVPPLTVRIGDPARLPPDFAVRRDA